jgi:hypothetical protein
MNSESRGQQLHDRATRGEVLTAEEQVELARWYADQDNAEATMLDGPLSPDENGRLQRQVDATLDQLRVVTERIQALALENDAARREIADLRQRLTQRPASRTA